MRPRGSVVAESISQVTHYSKNPDYYLAGYLDPNGKYLTVDQFMRLTGEMEDRLGHPDVAFENLSSPVFCRKDV